LWNNIQNWIRSGVEWLWNQIRTKLGEVYTILTKTVSDIANTVWNLLPDWIRNAISYVALTIMNLSKPLANFLKDPIGTLIDLAKKVWDYLPDFVKAPLTWIENTFKNIANALSSFLKDPVGALKSGFDHVVNSAKKFIDDSIQFVKDRANWLWNTISNALTKAKDYIVNAFQSAFDAASNAISDTLKNIFGGFGDLLKKWYALVSAFWAWVADQFVKFFQGSFRHVIVAFMNAMITVYEAVVNAWKSVIEWFIKNFIMKFREYLKVGSPPKEELEPFIEINNLYFDLARRYIREMKSSPEVSLGAYSKAIELAAHLQILKGSVQGIAMALEHVQPLKDWDFHEYARDLIETFGVTKVTDTILAAPLLVGMLPWVQYYINAVFRPKIPSMGDLMQFRGHGFIDKATFTKYMQYHGIPDEWIPIYEKLTWTIPSVGALQEMLARRVISESDFKAYVRWYGYDDLFVEAFKKTAYRYMIPFYLAYVLEDAVPSKELTMKIIRDMGFSPELDDMMYKYIVKRSIRFKYGGIIAQVRNLVRAGLWSAKDAIEYFKKVGIPDFVIDDLRKELQLVQTYQEEIEKERERRREENFRRSSYASAVIRLFKEGMITREELINVLRDVGYTDLMIERVLKLAELEFKYDFCTDYIKMLKEMYMNDEISDEDLEALLTTCVVVSEKRYVLIHRWREMKERRKKRAKE